LDEPNPIPARGAYRRPYVSALRPWAEASWQDPGELVPAGIARRAGAFVFDAVVLSAVCYLPALWLPSRPAWALTYVGYILRLDVRTGSTLGSIDLANVPIVAGFVAAVAGSLTYFVLCETRMAGQSPGKQAFGIRVVPDGRRGPVAHGEALVRPVAFVATTLMLGASLVAILWDPRRRAWHDRISGTVVVRSTQRGSSESLAKPVVLSGLVTAVLALGISIAVLVRPLHP